MYGNTSSNEAEARSAGSLNLSKSGGTTMFTRLSVHCALSITAMSRWNAESKCNSVSGIGWLASNQDRILEYLSFLSIGS